MTSAKTYCPDCGFDSGCTPAPAEPAEQVPVIWQDILAQLSAAARDPQ